MKKLRDYGQQLNGVISTHHIVVAIVDIKVKGEVQMFMLQIVRL
jgi:hypothetical protein